MNKLALSILLFCVSVALLVFAAEWCGPAGRGGFGTPLPCVASVLLGSVFFCAGLFVRNSKLFIAVATVSLCFGMNAATLYVSPSGAGAANGSGLDNALAEGFTPVRGNTYLLTNGVYSAKTWDTAWSIPMTDITISPAPGCIAYWPQGVTFDSSHWNFDGVTGGGPGSWTTGHGFIFTNQACAASMNFIQINSGLHAINISHCSFRQIGNTEACGTQANGIACAAGEADVYDSTWSYNHFDNLGGLPFALRRMTNMVIEYNWTGNICGVSVFNFNLHCEVLVMWEGDGIDFRYNALNECPSSGGFVKNATNMARNVRIYGNVFQGGGQFIAINGADSVLNAVGWRVVNNTFVNQTYGNSGPVGGDLNVDDYAFFNNLIVSNTGVRAMFGAHGWNYFSVSAIASTMFPVSTENIEDRSAWPASDVLLQGSWNPFVNITGNTPEDFRLTAVITNWPGTNATSLFSDSRYAVDIFGNPRGADGVWDRGAIEFGAPVAPRIAIVTGEKPATAKQYHGGGGK